MVGLLDERPDRRGPVKVLPEVWRSSRRAGASGPPSAAQADYCADVPPRQGASDLRVVEARSPGRLELCRVLGAGSAVGRVLISRDRSGRSVPGPASAFA
jgi:hypothetical protein